MRSSQSDGLISPSGVTFKRRRSLQLLAGCALLYVALLCFFELPLVSRKLVSPFATGALPLDVETDDATQLAAPLRPSKLSRPAFSPSLLKIGAYGLRRPLVVSGLDFGHMNASSDGRPPSAFHRSAAHAWDVGRRVFTELEAAVTSTSVPKPAAENRTKEECPHSFVLTGAQFRAQGNILELPCGMAFGTYITLTARPHRAHEEYGSKIVPREEMDKPNLVSQFMMELQGLKIVDGEEPPRILHFNPRIRGDWSGYPVIEQNTCYRMQWGTPMRCEGWQSSDAEETVDGMVKCEKWYRDDGKQDSDKKSWLNRWVGSTKTSPNWPYPFVEDRVFVLTLSAGLEGYHVHVDGRHITAFPYRIGFVLEDATGFWVNGDISVESVFAGSLPTSHPSFAPQRQLELSPKWQAPPLPDGPVDFFIGILSSGNHFGERMAVRKSWMSGIKNSPNIVARFFVALHGRKEVNVELKKEAEFFGDIVIVPFMDNYDLVVLKTLAICEYGIRVVSAKNIMKCDDDTFVRVDAVMDAMKKVPKGKSLYIGNINYYHTPLREGKWAVTYEEWPEQVYPPYANGPGYVISADIANYIMTNFQQHILRFFKMEDVSMGMWVQQFSNLAEVAYIHDHKFCQFGCIEDYFTAHYQSPRQMMCLWDKLQAGWADCCNMR